MRILKRNGHEAAVVGLGEELQLKIEIDPTSAFGIFVRNLEARTDNGELLTLIDNVGCPRDASIFPALRLGPNRELSADFKAFRFPSTATVNFVATVQFCQDTCEPIRCNSGIQSYGKRRRRSLYTSDMNAENMTEEHNFNTSLLPELSSDENIENGSGIDPRFSLPESTSVACTEENEVNPTTISLEADTTEANISDGENRQTVVSSTELSRSSSEVPPAPENEIPSELPLQLRLVVGENSMPNLSKPSTMDQLNKRSDIITGNIRSKTNAADVSYSSVTTENDNICLGKSLVTASVIVLTFFNIGLLSGFVFFYKVRKNQWKNEVKTDMSKQCVTIPEVLFRNVYDRIPRSTSIPFSPQHKQLSV